MKLQITMSDSVKGTNEGKETSGPENQNNKESKQDSNQDRQDGSQGDAGDDVIDKSNMDSHKGKI